MKIEFENKTILVAPLDWGLGHATRCIPIIRALLKKGNRVILGGTPLTKKILEEEFPQLEQVDLPEYAISYSNVLPIWLKLATQYSRIKAIIKQEHYLLQSLIKSKNIEVVISDNRYGLFNKSIPSIIVCHQINVLTPFFTRLANKIHVTLLNNFNEVWVPDFEEESKKLAGNLSVNVHGLKCKYIGPISRMEKQVTDTKYDYLFLLSGPEPAQTILLKKVLIKSTLLVGKKIAVVSSSHSDFKTTSTITFRQLPNAKELSMFISQSHTIICRSGYSTLMDMYIMAKKDLVLIPTKGQTEQEYLAQYWKEKYNIVILKETEINKYSF